MKKAILFLALTSILFSCYKGYSDRKSEFYICGYYDLAGPLDEVLRYSPWMENHTKHKIEY